MKRNAFNYPNVNIKILLVQEIEDRFYVNFKIKAC